MSRIREIRDVLLEGKRKAAGQPNKVFLPEGALEQILCRENISDSLHEPVFRIPQHKLESTVDLIFNKGKKILAILIETRLEHSLIDFIEHGLYDADIPTSEERLESVLAEPNHRQIFTERQWHYSALKFSSGFYVQRLSTQCVLPYLEETEIGSGGFSSVYKVVVHAAHQSIEPELRKGGLSLVRKKLERINPRVKAEDEFELLFILRHPNIVPLLTAYAQDGTYNLLLPLADMDLDEFLSRMDHVDGLKEDRHIMRAAHGLASGLKHLHYFRQETELEGQPSISLQGTHQDIKPKNVLVKGVLFILADFGLSRLKPVEENSQTIWKDSTPSYSAPECRDEDTWVPRKVGRASDIWSLGCMICELVIFIHSGPDGVRSFRNQRTTQLPHGKQDAFHDGKRVKDEVLDALGKVKEDAESLAICSTVALLQDIFAENPERRPDAKEVVGRLEGIVLQRFIQDILQIVKTLSKLPDVNHYEGSFLIERTRFSAWAMGFGFMPLPQEIISPILIPAPFMDLCDTFEATIKGMESLHFSPSTNAKGSRGLLTLRQCNNTIYDSLPENLRAKADSLIPILFIENANSRSISTMSLTPVPEYADTSRIAAIRYMSQLFQEESVDPSPKTRLKLSQIEKDLHSNDYRVSPEVYWYDPQLISNPKQKVLVEWRDYGRNLDHTRERAESLKQVKASFRRLQNLIALLQKPLSSNFRVLPCLGAVEDHQQTRFGVVYQFPEENSQPIRLHYLLKEGGSKGKRQPHLGLKFALARSMAACLKDVHLSGWMHKNICSYNILFFASENQPTDEEYGMPFLTGFQYGREDDTGSPSSGPDSDREMKEYEHPDYRGGSSPFRREYDYYSLGLVLLEIGVWESLSKVYTRLSKSTFSQRRDVYMGLCGKQLLERMGPIYSEATKTCLEAAYRFNDSETDSILSFQYLVIDRLNQCTV